MHGDYQYAIRLGVAAKVAAANRLKLRPKTVPKLARTPELEALRSKVLRTPYPTMAALKAACHEAWGPQFILYIRTRSPIGDSYTYSAELRKNLVEV